MGILAKIKALVGLHAKSEEKPFISVVLLLRRPGALTQDMLHDAAVRAWGREFRAEDNECVLMEGALGIVTFENRMFHTINSAQLYVENPERMARELKEMRQQKVMREHAAWMSVNLLQPENPDVAEKAECYRRLCSLAAQFVDGLCLGVYLTEDEYLRPNDSTVRDALVSANPRKQIRCWENVPVISVKSTDSELKNAVGEARRRWPEFVQAFQNRKQDQPFSVKVPFTDGMNTEWMWVIVSELRGDFVAGELGNSPINVRGLREGDRVHVQAKDIGDWIYSDGLRPIGGFSVAIIAKSQAR